MLNIVGVHLLEIDTVVPDGESGARWSTKHPIGILFIDHAAGQLAIGPLAKIPWCTIWFQDRMSKELSPSTLRLRLDLRAWSKIEVPYIYTKVAGG